MKAVLCFSVGKQIRSKVVDSVIKSDGYLTHSGPHSVRTVLRYITVKNDKVGIVNFPRKKPGFHKHAVTETTEQILWLRKLSPGVKQTAAIFKSRWLDPAVSCSWCVITLQ